MTENGELTSLEDIKCEKIVEMIVEATDVIIRFKEVLNNNLIKVQLFEPKILFVKKHQNVYSKDNEYTGTEEYEYDVYWIFRYIDSSESGNIFNILSNYSYMWTQYCMFFKMRLSEIIEGHKFCSYKFFQLFITDGSANENSKIVSYDDQFHIRCMLCEKNICKCAMVINNIYKKWEKEQKIKNELRDFKFGIDTIDIKDYIKKNTL